MLIRLVILINPLLSYSAVILAKVGARGTVEESGHEIMASSFCVNRNYMKSCMAQTRSCLKYHSIYNTYAHRYLACNFYS